MSNFLDVSFCLTRGHIDSGFILPLGLKRSKVVRRIRGCGGWYALVFARNLDTSHLRLTSRKGKQGWASVVVADLHMETGWELQERLRLETSFGDYA